MSDQNSPSSRKPQGRFHTRDLRLAGAISAGLVSAILVGGALLAPVANWDGLSSSRALDETKDVQLADLPAERQAPDGGGGSGPQTGPSTAEPGTGGADE